MARTVSYGMGQYRFTKNYDYITPLPLSDESQKYWKIGTATTGYYRDILVDLPTTNGTPVVQYGQTYFLKLAVPQNRQYTITLNLKLCPADTSGNPILERFQQIGRLEIPPIPNSDNIYSEVVLYQDPTSVDPEDPSDFGTPKVGLIDADHDETRTAQELPHNINELYKTLDNDSGEIKYIYYYEKQNSQDSEEDEEFSIESIPVINFNSTKLLRSWEIMDEDDNIVTYKLVFSPKYNLAEGYRYLLIETDRNNIWTNELQYIDNEGNTYNGTYLNLSSVRVELYGVNDLLVGASDGSSQIKSGTNVLNHIAIWGHPEQILAINGEEIKIGQSNFYEIKDYNITSLGVVVEDPNVDRFTIDYEYKINS